MTKGTESQKANWFCLEAAWKPPKASGCLQTTHGNYIMVIWLKGKCTELGIPQLALTFSNCGAMGKAF